MVFGCVAQAISFEKLEKKSLHDFIPTKFDGSLSFGLPIQIDYMKQKKRNKFDTENWIRTKNYK